MKKEDLSPAAMRRRARELEDQALELTCRATELRRIAATILRKRAETRRAATKVTKGKTYDAMRKRIRANR